MGNKNDIIWKWYKEELCNDNPLCAAEKDAKQRGTWFFQISFLGYKGTMMGDRPATQTIGGTFEVFEFAPKLKSWKSTKKAKITSCSGGQRQFITSSV